MSIASLCADVFDLIIYSSARARTSSTVASGMLRRPWRQGADGFGDDCQVPSRSLCTTRLLLCTTLCTRLLQSQVDHTDRRTRPIRGEVKADFVESEKKKKANQLGRSHSTSRHSLARTNSFSAERSIVLRGLLVWLSFYTSSHRAVFLLSLYAVFFAVFWPKVD